jgi:hypothetical protein
VINGAVEHGRSRVGGGSDRRRALPVGSLLAGRGAVAGVSACWLELDAADADARSPPPRAGLCCAYRTKTRSSPTTLQAMATARCEDHRATTAFARHRLVPSKPGPPSNALSAPRGKPRRLARCQVNRLIVCQLAMLAIATDASHGVTYSVLPSARKYATRNTMTIVHTDYRPKRTRKKKPAVPLTGPRITSLIRRAPAPPSDKADTNPEDRNGYNEPDAEQSAPSSEIPKIPKTRPVIVTAKNPRRGQFGDVPAMTPEEHERRGDAAEALFREIVRRVRQ